MDRQEQIGRQRQKLAQYDLKAKVIVKIFCKFYY
jgi:hypothetical protein